MEVLPGSAQTQKPLIAKVAQQLHHPFSPLLHFRLEVFNATDFSFPFTNS